MTTNTHAPAAHRNFHLCGKRASQRERAMPSITPIAVVGMGCRLPGNSSSPERLWEVLINGRSCYTKVPSNRFNIDAFRHKTDKINTVAADGAHFLTDNVAAFDAPFFNISPSDAMGMDPQQRMLLEVVYEALESGGIRMESLAGTDTSCHVGCFTRDWSDIHVQDPESAPQYTATGIGNGMLANRVSWFFDWRGPSLTLDTACSSSLVALHLACQAIHDGSSKVAVAAGTNLILNPIMSMWLSNMNFLSKDGVSKAFDAEANGYGRGEGIAAVVLKPLEDAIRDKDCIRAVIRSTGVNQDGHTSGITLPNPAAQADLIASVYGKAGLSYDDTTYFEAHGTGTSAGDAGEMLAIGKTIMANREPSRTLYVGSIKTNIGHTEGTAGLAGLLKTILVLEKGVIPPSVHLKRPNPKIPFEKLNIRVPTAPTPWPSKGIRRASINSFGYGGTNAHVIVDDAASYLRQEGLDGRHNTQEAGLSDAPDSSLPPLSDSASHHASRFSPTTGFRLCVFSAHEDSVVYSMQDRYSAYIEGLADKGSGLDWRNIDQLAFTLGSRRSVLPWKSFAVAPDLQSMTKMLRARDVKPTRSFSKPRVAFVFTGQGAQWARMGLQLLAYEVFRDSLRDADRYLRSQLGCEWSVMEELALDSETSRLHLARHAQPISTILQIGLVELLRSWGIEPIAVVGHSSGEIAAAVCAGAMTREAGWKTAYWRGKLSTDMATQNPTIKGAMVAVGTSATQVEPYIARVRRGRVQLACSNSPESVTLSGDEMAVDEIEEMLKSDGLFARKLKVENAYHSYHMALIAEAYLASITDCAFLPPGSSSNVKMVSSVTKETLDFKDIDPSYWVENLTSPVQFSDALASLLKGETRRRRRGGESAIDFLLEIGPHSALQGPVKQIIRSEGLKNVGYASVLKRGDDAVKTAMEAAGVLYAHGLDVNLNAVNQIHEPPAPLVNLPSYPWNHRTYWLESRVSKAYKFRSRNRVDLLGAPVADTIEGEPAWRNFLRPSEMPWIRDHKIQSSILYPAAGMICMVIEAARQIADPSRELEEVELRDVRLERPMVIADEDSGIETKLQLLAPKTNSLIKSWFEFKISSAEGEGNLQLNCCGFVSLKYKTATLSNMALREKTASMEHFTRTLSEKEHQCLGQIDSENFYSNTEAVGLQYGPAFQNLKHIRRSGDSACATVVVHDTQAMTINKYEDTHLIHPSTLDCMFQLLFATLVGDSRSTDMGAVPVFVKSLKVAADCPSEPGHGLRGFADVSVLGLTEHTANIIFGAQDGSGPKVTIEGLLCKAIGSSSSDDAGTVATKERYGLLETAPDLRLSTTLHLASWLRGKSKATGAPQHLAMVVELILHSEPHATILELCSSSSSEVRTLLGSLSKTERSPILTANWTVANLDVDARESFAAEAVEFGAAVTLKTVDIPTAATDSSNPSVQYDAIIIGRKYAKNIDSTLMSSLVALLNDGGLLVVIADPDLKASFGSWYALFGLQNIVSVPTSSMCGDSSSIVIASKTFPMESSEPQDHVVLLLPAAPSKECATLVSRVSRYIEGSGRDVRLVYFRPSSLKDVYRAHCISFLEFETQAPLDTNPEIFGAIRTMLLQSSRMLWLSRNTRPHFSVTAGLFRTVRNENPNLDLVYLALGSTASYDLQHIADLIARAFLSEHQDKELLLDEGLLQTTRYVPDTRLNANIANQRDKSANELMDLSEASVGFQLDIRHPGLLDTMYFKIDRKSGEDLLPDEVELDTRAFGLNFRDVMTLMGQLSDPDIGREASGMVTRVGSAVTKFKPGDRVYQAIPGSFKTRLRSRENLCQHIPDGMSFAEAASIPLVFTTALCAVRDLARLRPGESILIHAAAGGVGQAAIQLARHYKAEIYVTVGSEAKAEMLQQIYGIPKDHIFSSRDASFAEGIKRMTNGRGVDVVLNSLAGELLRQTWHCVAAFGRFVEIGIKDIADHAALDMGPFKNSISFAFLNLNLMVTDYPDKLNSLMEDVASFLRHGVIRPVHTVSEFSATDIQAAMRFMQAGKHMGKIVITLSPSDKISVHPTARNLLRLKPDATYVIVGGLGGLGRSLAMHMADCGAKSLAFLSRSGPSDPKASDLGSELSKRGTRAAFYSCDIAEREHLEQTLEACSQELPPIAGCVQGAMVLRDGIFETMSHENFKASLRPKVQGSWNLHELLPRNLDFFVMLSSISGATGNPGQANYAAGNTFMDALAHYRRQADLPALSLDLGLMVDVGFVAERQGTSNLKKWESVGLVEEELLLLMSAAMRGVLPPSGNDGPYTLPPQVVTGLATGGHIASLQLEPPFYFTDPRFKQLVHAELASGTSSGYATDEADILRSALKSSTSAVQASDVVIDAVRSRLARVMGTDAANVEAGKPLHAYGVDSLMAVEMRNWLVKEMRCDISLFDVVGAPAIADLAAKIVETSKLVQKFLD
ncbi:ketoacyl-synt-domain-containing protein [Thozetella sp. PMI_491]|nr:ketoacyl-synt-domain-containing protein [Thozetella sp. PMI_491]